MSGFVTPYAPNLADYATFVYSAPQTPTGAPIPTSALPADSPWIGYSFEVAMQLAWRRLQEVSALIYTLAVYNLALDRLINFSPDQAGQTYFYTLRASPPIGYGVNNFIPGVVTATSDVSTSTTLTSPEFMKSLTFLDLSVLKTPFGQVYLQYTQQLGDLWGIS
jgi:hypothetical protein